MGKTSIARQALATLAASIGFSCVYAFVACRFGFLFGGLEAGFAVVATVAFCCIAVFVTAIILERKGVTFTWRAICGEIAVLAFLGIGLYSWTQTAKAMRMFLAPAPVPTGLHVHHGRTIMFSAFVHFTGSPADIAAIIQSKGLLEVAPEPPEQGDTSGYSHRERTKRPWGWWKPMTMSGPRFYFRSHETKAPQGWGEGWWVNTATNEVYAFISG